MDLSGTGATVAMVGTRTDECDVWGHHDSDDDDEDDEHDANDDDPEANGDNNDMDGGFDIKGNIDRTMSGSCHGLRTETCRAAESSVPADMLGWLNI